MTSSKSRPTQRQMYVEVGARLKDARLATKKSQNEVVALLGWKSSDGQSSRLSQYEKGKRKIALDELARLADIYGQDPAYLAFGVRKLDPRIDALIRDYSSSDEKTQAMVRAILDADLKGRGTQKKGRAIG